MIESTAFEVDGIVYRRPSYWTDEGVWVREFFQVFDDHIHMEIDDGCNYRGEIQMWFGKPSEIPVWYRKNLKKAIGVTKMPKWDPWRWH